MPSYSPPPWTNGGAPGISAAQLQAISNVCADAVQTDGTNAANFVQVGSGNLANTPIQIIVVGPDSSHLPAAGVKGRIAFVVPFSLP